MTMSKKQRSEITSFALFLTKVREILGKDSVYFGFSNEDQSILCWPRYPDQIARGKKREAELVPSDYKIGVEWVSGGVTGGSCWDTSESHSHHPRDGEIESDLGQLDLLLETLIPGITLRVYKKLLRALVKRNNRTEYEYYGNSTVYGQKFVVVEELYNYLVNEKILPSPDSTSTSTENSK